MGTLFAAGVVAVEACDSGSGAGARSRDAAPVRRQARIGAVAHRLRILGAILRSPPSLFDRRFECPICAFRGPFITVKPPTGPRRHARCPRCGGLERHRLQCLVAREALRGRDTGAMDAAHFAPEPFFLRIFDGWFRSYLTADLDRRDVDRQADLRRLPFPDGTFDFVFASHVLEHIDDDARALGEIARVLRPGGIAILPVPIVAARTIEYPHPVATEHGHVRAPGLDYYDRYRRYFGEVLVRTSADFDEAYQTWTYEDRSRYPDALCPYRLPMAGVRHLDAVPVCRRMA